jgi:hypothetical protein
MNRVHCKLQSCFMLHHLQAIKWKGGSYALYSQSCFKSLHRLLLIKTRIRSLALLSSLGTRTLLGPLHGTNIYPQGWTQQSMFHSLTWWLKQILVPKMLGFCPNNETMETVKNMCQFDFIPSSEKSVWPDFKSRIHSLTLALSDRNTENSLLNFLKKSVFPLESMDLTKCVINKMICTGLNILIDLCINYQFAFHWKQNSINKPWGKVIVKIGIKCCDVKLFQIWIEFKNDKFIIVLVFQL